MDLFTGYGGDELMMEWSVCWYGGMQTLGRYCATGQLGATLWDFWSVCFSHIDDQRWPFSLNHWKSICKIWEKTFEHIQLTSIHSYFILFLQFWLLFHSFRIERKEQWLGKIVSWYQMVSTWEAGFVWKIGSIPRPQRLPRATPTKLVIWWLLPIWNMKQQHSSWIVTLW